MISSRLSPKLGSSTVAAFDLALAACRRKERSTHQVQQYVPGTTCRPPWAAQGESFLSLVQASCRPVPASSHILVGNWCRHRLMSGRATKEGLGIEQQRQQGLRLTCNLVVFFLLLSCNLSLSLGWGGRGLVGGGSRNLSWLHLPPLLEGLSLQCRTAMLAPPYEGSCSNDFGKASAASTLNSLHKPVAEAQSACQTGYVLYSQLFIVCLLVFED